MADLKNIRRERFCHLIVQGKPASVAYVEAGYKASTPHSAEANGSALMRSHDVQSRIVELKAPIVKELQLSVPNSRA